MRLGRLTRVAAAAGGPLLLVGGLLVLAPPGGLSAGLAAGVRADDGGAMLLRAALGLAAWTVVGLLLVSVLAAVAASLPGTAGRAGRALTARITPTVVRRLVGGGAAVGLAFGPALVPLAAGAATPRAAACAPLTAGLPSLDRPAVQCADDPGPPPASPQVAPALRATVPATGHVVVAGDSLWSLARADLAARGVAATPARVAARWPAWWQANRAELGDQPGLLHPGEMLATPPA